MIFGGYYFMSTQMFLTSVYNESAFADKWEART
jgi:hypothetical protein